MSNSFISNITIKIPSISRFFAKNVVLAKRIFDSAKIILYYTIKIIFMVVR